MTFALAGVISGLLYVQLGLSVRRKRLVAIRAVWLTVPFFVFLSVLLVGAAFYELEAEPDFPYWFGDPVEDTLSELVWSLFFVFLSFWFFLSLLGQVLVLRVGTDDVPSVLERLLAHRNLGYVKHGTVLDVGPGQVRIEVSTISSLNLVGVRITGRDRELKASVRKDLMKVFKGRPDDASYPFLVMVGITVIVGWELVLAGIFLY